MISKMNVHIKNAFCLEYLHSSLFLLIKFTCMVPAAFTFPNDTSSLICNYELCKCRRGRWQNVFWISLEKLWCFVVRLRSQCYRPGHMLTPAKNTNIIRTQQMSCSRYQCIWRQHQIVFHNVYFLIVHLILIHLLPCSCACRLRERSTCDIF